MPPKSTGRKVLGEANNKANQNLTPKASSNAKQNASGAKEPEHIDLTTERQPEIFMVSGGSASIGQTVDGIPLSSLPDSLSDLKALDGTRKRKAVGPPPPNPSTVDLDDYDVEGLPIDKNPDQVRRQIRRFLDSDGMKVGEFCNALGVSNNA